MELTWLAQFMQQHRLPQRFQTTVEHYYWPLAQSLAQQAQALDQPLLLGIHGCQGSGKSTLTTFLCAVLTELLDVPAVGMSIDDFYRTRTERQQLARQVHPLLITRGVPGTHDTDFLNEVLSGLLQQQVPMMIPRFNKAMDDRFSPSEWTVVEQPQRIIILEGWCVGVEAQAISALQAPVNHLEAKHDRDGQWRHYVNQQLAQRYWPIFQQIDRLLMLRAPSFDSVLQWRTEQEHALRASMACIDAKRQPNQLMSDDELAYFIAHYQRLTEHALATMPDRVDDCFTLSSERAIRAWRTRGDS